MSPASKDGGAGSACPCPARTAVCTVTRRVRRQPGCAPATAVVPRNRASSPLSAPHRTMRDLCHKPSGHVRVLPSEAYTRPELGHSVSCHIPAAAPSGDANARPEATAGGVAPPTEVKVPARTTATQPAPGPGLSDARVRFSTPGRCLPAAPAQGSGPKVRPVITDVRRAGVPAPLPSLGLSRNLRLARLHGLASKSHTECL